MSTDVVPPISAATDTDIDPSPDAYGLPVRVVPDGTVADDIHKLTTGISVASSALPAGASTEAKQDAGNASLASIDSKTPALGQALAAASEPVVLPAAQEASLRDVSDRAARLLGHVAVDSSALPSGAATSALQGTTFDLDTGAGVEQVAGVNLRKSASGGSVELGTPSDPIRVDPTGTTTQPISATSLPLPAGAATEATLSSLNGKVVHVDTGAVVVASSALPSGASTAALQGTTFDLDSGVGVQNVSGVSLRKTASGGSVELGTSSDPVRVDPTGTTTQPVSAASLPLPVGAATSANQATEIASLASIDSKTPVLGQALAAASVPVVLPAAQETSLRDTSDRAARLLGHVTVDSSTLPTGAATAALQGTTFDLDTGAGTQNVSGVSLRKSASGGSVELGTNADPVRTDPTGTTTQPVSGTVTANQGTAAATAGAWPIKVTDGTNVSTVKAANTAAVAADTAQVVALSPNSPTPTGANAIGSLREGIIATYSASTNGTVATATAANTVTSIAYLFHPNTNTKRVKIQRIVFAWAGNGGNNSLSARGCFITSENGTPGGTAATINAHDQADAASTLTFRYGATGAPTRSTGDLLSVAMIGGSAAQSSIDLFNAGLVGKPIILRASQNEGFEVRTVIGGSNIASAINCSVSFTWTEE